MRYIEPAEGIYQPKRGSSLESALTELVKEADGTQQGLVLVYKGTFLLVESESNVRALVRKFNSRDKNAAFCLIGP